MNFRYDFPPSISALFQKRDSYVALLRLRQDTLTCEEFERLLKVTESVVGPEAAPSWKYILRGLWDSGLRLNELMHVSWDNPLMIMPLWREGRHPVLHIPHDMQKNANDESIPG